MLTHQHSPFAAQNGSLVLCTAHPAKQDLPAFEGLTEEEEEYYEQCVRAQTGAILHEKRDNHKYFSKQLMKYVEPDFRPSPPNTPERRRQQNKKRRLQAAARSAQAKAAELSEEEGPPLTESRDMSSMVAFWDDEEE